MFRLHQHHLHPTGRHAPKTTRLVSKDGRCNIEYKNSPCLIVEMRWRFVILLFVTSFMGIRFIFGLLWYVIAKRNGDLDVQKHTSEHAKCIDEVDGLITAFLYSVEMQTTIGYGGTLTGNCTSANILFVVQSLVGVFHKYFLVAVIVAKVSAPKKRGKTVIFSDTAVICLKAGRLCLLIRVANLRKTLLAGTQIYGKLVRISVTADGERIDQVDVDFTVDAGKENLFFVCPSTLYHVIDTSSPLYELSSDSLHQQDSELVVFLDGRSTSYLPREIQWGHTFLSCISETQTGKYSVDVSNFSRSVPVSTPRCAADLENTCL